MNINTVDDLIIANKPTQFIILQNLINLFTKNSHLTHTFVRGSIAKNQVDRISDIDLVLAYSDYQYVRCKKHLETDLRKEFNVIFPGWADKIVPNFGGVGYVYLLEYQKEIFQVDVYLMPIEKVESFSRTIEAKLVYLSESLNNKKSNSELIEYSTLDLYAKNQSLESYLVEFFVLIFLISKRIERSQIFLNYSETMLLNTAIKNFLREAFDQQHIDYGWYYLRENMVVNSCSRKWIDYLEHLVRDTPVHSSKTLRTLMLDLCDLLKDITPNLFKTHEESINLYLNYFRHL